MGYEVEFYRMLNSDASVFARIMTRQALLSEAYKYYGKWYKEESPKIKNIVSETVYKTKTPNVEVPLLINLGGPFEQVGGDDEAIGSDRQKVD